MEQEREANEEEEESAHRHRHRHRHLLVSAARVGKKKSRREEKKKTYFEVSCWFLKSKPKLENRSRKTVFC
jgi:hypothetical protein